MTMRFGTVIALLVVFSLVACETPTDQFGQGTTSRQDGITARIPPDPSPYAAGQWIGYSFTECETFGTDDLDSDGFRDTCEKRIAEFFRPFLYMSNGDNTKAREPYWAVKKTTLIGDQAVDGASLFWAFAYYEDGGVTDPLCTLGQGICDGHYGDSEYVVLDIEYNTGTQHWELMGAVLSQHNSPTYYDAGYLEFPDRYLGYPAVYVATNKHANYSTHNECQGAIAGFEECHSNYNFRETFNGYRNVGSASDQLIDCVESVSRYAGNGEQECFWDDPKDQFLGWTGISNGNNIIAPYGDKLREYGF